MPVRIVFAKHPIHKAAENGKISAVGTCTAINEKQHATEKVTDALRGQFDSLEEQKLWIAYTRCVSGCDNVTMQCSVEQKRACKTRYLIRKQLWDYYRREVEGKAVAYHRFKMPRHSIADLDDIKQAAIYGALKAIDAYVVERSRPFMVFAAHRIYGAIIDMLRELQDFPRVVAKWRRELAPIIAKLQNRLNHKPTIDEICAIEGEDFRHILEDPLYASGVFNQAKHSYDYPGDASSNSDNVDQNAKTFDESIAQEQHDHVRESVIHQIEMQDKILGVLPKTHTFIIFAYYFLQPGWTNTRIAKQIKKSNSTTVNMHNEALDILRKHFTLDQFVEIINWR